MDNIKDSFKRVKEDINSIQSEINSLKSTLNLLKTEMIEICDILSKLSNKFEQMELTTANDSSDSSLGTTLTPTNQQTHQQTDRQTDQHINPTIQHIIPTHNFPLKPLKDINLTVSIGNQGVPTDRQTDRQTDQQTHQHIISKEKFPMDPIENASQLLDSLDELKKELRLKFKRLTDQELIVFSTIYQLEEEQGFSDYKSLSQKLNLTESSIRDYVGRLFNKKIPLEKKKVNNKTIHIFISPNLKKVASLSTIIKLRDI